MACIVLQLPDKKVALQLKTHGDKGTVSDDEHTDNLRMILGVLLAKHMDVDEGAYDPDAFPDLNEVISIATSWNLVEKGYAKITKTNGSFIANYSYINYTRVTSKWAKENHPTVTCQITARITLAVNDFSNVVETHTLIVYF